MSAVSQAETRILAALQRLGEATMAQLFESAGIKPTTGHKAMSLLKDAGMLRIVGQAPGVTKAANIYAINNGTDSDTADAAFRETDEQAVMFARLLRSVHPAGYAGLIHVNPRNGQSGDVTANYPR
jgi:hypothetical protein